MHTSMLDKKLIQYCRNNRLRLWIFSIENHAQYLKYSQSEGIDMIFSDNAIETLHILS